MSSADRVACGGSLRPEQSCARDCWQVDPQRRGQAVTERRQACTPSTDGGQESTGVLWTRGLAVSERAGALGPILDGFLEGQTGLPKGKAGGGLWTLRVHWEKKWL